MASRDPADLHPIVRAQWLDLKERCQLLGIELFTTCTLRSAVEQDRLYQRGRTTSGPIVTWAGAWKSFHQPWSAGRALAFDVAFRPPGDPTGATWSGPWDVVGAIGEWIGLEWGGRWKVPDRPHFQNPLGMSLQEWRREAGFE